MPTGILEIEYVTYLFLCCDLYITIRMTMKNGLNQVSATFVTTAVYSIVMKIIAKTVCSTFITGFTKNICLKFLKVSQKISVRYL